ncbi:WD repeat-containing protein 55-like [Eleutherodactylus coqui]|uniref:WD repeat-containing protein 55-like n=1 Tax=Eleutherodactylus coqui TaxID=57060 RepID=UPI0034623B34
MMMMMVMMMVLVLVVVMMVTMIIIRSVEADFRSLYGSSVSLLFCLCPAVIHERGKKVSCGSSEGTIYLFNGFGATSDHFTVKAESIGCMIPINDNIVCTGSVDGIIRAVNILPNRVIGTVGQHPGEPIEQLAKSRDGRFLASCAHDQKVKFWDVSNIGSIIVDVYRKRKKNQQLQALSKKAFGGADDFYADMKEDQAEAKEKEDEDEEESDSDDSDSH